MKILENLWQVGGAEFTSVEDAAVYLVRFGEKAVLIDAGCGNAQEEMFENISKVLPPQVVIEYLLLTHCHYDHTGGAEAARKGTAAGLWPMSWMPPTWKTATAR